MRASPLLYVFPILLAACTTDKGDTSLGTDDSDVVAGVTAAGFSKSSCLEYFSKPESSLIVTDMGGGTVHVDHMAWQGNCCTDVAVTLAAKAPNVDVTYVETGEQCFCMCRFDLDYDLSGLTPGDWTIHAAGDTATVTVGD
jgi:hypothetical protein